MSKTNSINNINILNALDNITFKPKSDLSEWNGIFVFVEIQDHERVLDGSLELLTKARELSRELNEPVYAVTFGLEVEQYFDEIKKYGPDFIIYSTCSDQTLKHYNSEIFTEMWDVLISKYKPSIVLFPSTEAGSDLAPRLAQRYGTGLTAHCSDLSISIVEKNNLKLKLLVMQRPAFSGNMNASIIIPNHRPQMATVQQGVFKKVPIDLKNAKEPEFIESPCTLELSKLKVINIEPPTRYQRINVPLEKARVVVAGGRGLGSKENFDKLFELAKLLGGEVGATRVAVFEGWCENERMIGQTGKTVKPDLYIAFGISGQIQHTTSIMDSKRIISVNTDPNAMINQISDYVIIEDAPTFLDNLIKKIKEEKKFFNQ